MDEMYDLLKQELEDIYADLSNGCCSMNEDDLDALDERRIELEQELSAYEQPKDS